MSTSLSLLRSRKQTVLAGMDNARKQISTVEDKIERLRETANELSRKIGELETAKSSIDGLTIDESSWKGKNKQTFEGNYSDYQHAVKQYISKAKDAKEEMEEEITRYETSKANYMTGLNNLENTLTSLEYQIREAEAKKE